MLLNNILNNEDDTKLLELDLRNRDDTMLIALNKNNPRSSRTS